MRNDESSSAYGSDGGDLPQITAVIDTTSGPVRGLINDGVHTFKGVRYGAPPVGPLRWMPPEKPAPSKAILDSSDYGAPAMQMASGAVASPPGDYGMMMARVFTTPSELKIQNEDCLFLNVWTPATDNRKRPVMFWIHGGIFAYGSGNQPIYCPGDKSILTLGLWGDQQLNTWPVSLVLLSDFPEAYLSDRLATLGAAKLPDAQERTLVHQYVEDAHLIRSVVQSVIKAYDPAECAP